MSHKLRSVLPIKIRTTLCLSVNALCQIDLSETAQHSQPNLRMGSYATPADRQKRTAWLYNRHHIGANQKSAQFVALLATFVYNPAH